MVTPVFVLALAGCGGGSGSSGAGFSLGNPLPNSSISVPVTFQVVQSDAVTPAAGVPVYVNRQNCSATCDVTYTTNGSGIASASLTAFATYCISVHNAYPTPATVPATPIYISGYGPQAYLESDECVKMGDIAWADYLAE